MVKGLDGLVWAMILWPPRSDSHWPPRSFQRAGSIKCSFLLQNPVLNPNSRISLLKSLPLLLFLQLDPKLDRARGSGRPDRSDSRSGRSAGYRVMIGHWYDRVDRGRGISRLVVGFGRMDDKGLNLLAG
ncbi:unnamed protein product [Microthlaspi erraticum]|uniref:Uncharacterized protein n=1 Tax=Microthlaspi erraticum TaxID=1685480 RepID=A0A6D2K1J2_9BRAS|nr:unnamed protein product [Microthlaspi erraticum]